MKYNKYFIASKEGKSNCVIRSFCKLLNKDYDCVYNGLCDIVKKLNRDSYNDIEVFEDYLRKYGLEKIEYGKDLVIKNLNLDNGSYAIFCWDKKDFYHMVAVIDDIVYDKDDSCFDLYVITVYKKK